MQTRMIKNRAAPGGWFGGALGAAVCVVLLYTGVTWAAGKGNGGAYGPKGGGWGHFDRNHDGGNGNLGNPGIAPPQSRLHGLSYGSLGDLWWKWAMSIPLASNPMADTTGAFANQGQKGPVYFLAGLWGPASAERTVTVPAGKALFFPIFNWVWMNAPEYGDNPWSPAQEAFVRAYLKAQVDAATGLACQIDGREVKNLAAYRSQTPQGQPDIYTTLPDGNIWGISAGTYGPTVQDGIFLMVEPLRPGNHTIHWISANGGVTYHLRVKKEGCPEGPDALGHCLAKFQQAYWQWAFGNLTLPVDANGNAVVCEDIAMMPMPNTPGDGTPGQTTVTLDAEQAFMLPLWCLLGNRYTDGTVDPPVDVDVYRTLDITLKIDGDTVVNPKNVMRFYSEFDFHPEIPFVVDPYVSFAWFQGIGVLYPGLPAGPHTIKLDVKNTQGVYGLDIYIEYHNTWDVTVKPGRDHGNHK
jgi:hypothetical protein